MFKKLPHSMTDSFFKNLTPQQLKMTTMAGLIKKSFNCLKLKLFIDILQFNNNTEFPFLNISFINSIINDSKILFADENFFFTKQQQSWHDSSCKMECKKHE